MKILRKCLSTARCIHTHQVLFYETPKNLKGMKHSSQLWLTRQLRDPYVEMAKQQNYRCRSAFKLLEMNEKYKFLVPGLSVIDCGAAPGSWTQVAVKLTNATGTEEKPIGHVFGIDKQPIYPIKGATLLGNMDFTKTEAQNALSNLLNNKKVNVVLSDMAPNASGIREMDHDNIMKLVYAALKFALHVTQVDGTFVAKIWDGRKSQQFEQDLLKFYKSVQIVRPQATRDESTEKFYLARGFKGLKTISSNKTMPSNKT